jgi:hypothetical protein
MSLRLKGQESKFALAGPSGLIPIVKIKSFDIVVLGDILEEHYIGDTAPEFDMISNGISAKATFHWTDPATLQFLELVRQVRDREVDPAANVIVAVGAYTFPSGATWRLVLKELAFGDIPISAKDRKSFVESSLDMKASRLRFI